MIKSPRTACSLDLLYGKALILVRRYYSEWELDWLAGHSRHLWPGKPWLFHQVGAENNLLVGLIHSYKATYALQWCCGFRTHPLPPQLPAPWSHFHVSLSDEPEPDGEAFP